MNKIILQIVGLAVFLSDAVGAFGRDTVAAGPDYPNETGWVWEMKPAPADWVQRGGPEGMVVRLDELKGERLLLTFAYPVATGRGILKFRPVAFNQSGQRLEFRLDGIGSNQEVVQEGHFLELKGAAREGIRFLGIEELTDRALREVLAPRAFRQLKDAGAQVLHYPAVGQPYEFELTSIDGKRISSKDLHGKVVLLDFWARWCGVCMAEMPKLKEVFAKLHPDGLEMIGINHDYSLDVAKTAIAKQDLPWPNVLAPAERSQRQLWEEATGVLALPRLLLIGRDGILRADVSPNDLIPEIEKLMAQ